MKEAQWPPLLYILLFGGRGGRERTNKELLTVSGNWNIYERHEVLGLLQKKSVAVDGHADDRKQA